MRTHRKSCRWGTASMFSVLVLAGSTLPASAQNNGSQVLRLPDPTPRELSPELRYPNSLPTPPLAQKRIAAQNEKRWELIVWATGEMVALSERAEKAAQTPTGDASKKELESNVVKIQSLAKSLTAALKAP